jgi:hypothetical protein
VQEPPGYEPSPGYDIANLIAAIADARAARQQDIANRRAVQASLAALAPALPDLLAPQAPQSALLLPPGAERPQEIPLARPEPQPKGPVRRTLGKVGAALGITEGRAGEGVPRRRELQQGIELTIQRAATDPAFREEIQRNPVRLQLYNRLAAPYGQQLPSWEEEEMARQAKTTSAIANWERFQTIVRDPNIPQAEKDFAASMFGAVPAGVAGLQARVEQRAEDVQAVGGAIARNLTPEGGVKDFLQWGAKDQAVVALTAPSLMTAMMRDNIERWKVIVQGNQQVSDEELERMKLGLRTFEISKNILGLTSPEQFKATFGQDAEAFLRALAKYISSTERAKPSPTPTVPAPAPAPTGARPVASVGERPADETASEEDVRGAEKRLFGGR